MIEDPWRSFECEADPAGCVVTFSDPEFPGLGRDAVYYARAIEEPSETINGGNLRCEPSSDGTIACEKLTPCAPWARRTATIAWHRPNIALGPRRSSWIVAGRGPLRASLMEGAM